MKNLFIEEGKKFWLILPLYHLAWTGITIIYKDIFISIIWYLFITTLIAVIWLAAESLWNKYKEYEYEKKEL